MNLARIPRAVPRRHRLAVLAAAGVAALAAAPAAGAVDWSPPAAVPDGAADAPPTSATRLGAATVTAADGTTWVSWIQTVPAAGTAPAADVVRVARRAPDGAWAPSEDVARRDRGAGERGMQAVGTGLALTADARPVVLWSQAAGETRAVRAATRGADGAWSAPAALGTESYGQGGGFDSSIVTRTLDDGRIVAAWHDAAAVQLAVTGPGGGFGATETVASDVQDFTEVDVAADAEGRLTVLWTAASDPRPHARTRGVAGRWGDVEILGDASDADAPAAAPRLDSDADGTLVAAWSPGADRVLTATRAPTATSWVLRSHPARGAQRRIAPDVAFDRHGAATLVWADQREPDADGNETGADVVTQIRRPDGTWASPVTAYASTADEGPAAPRVVVGATGQATVVWSDQRFGSPRFFRLTAATRPARDAAWAAAVALTDRLTGPTPPDALAADALGDVTLAALPLTAGSAASDVPVELRDLDLRPVVGTDWTSRWLPGAGNLRTFVRYLHGDPEGGARLSDGATQPEPLDRWGFRLTVADAYRDGATGETVIEHRGTVRLAMPSHFIDTRIVNPTVRIAADGRTATVIADGQGSGEFDPSATELHPDPFMRVHLLDLDLTQAGPRVEAQSAVRTWIGAPATVAAGASRYLAYGEGVAFGRFTITVRRDLRTVEPVGPAQPGGETDQPGGETDRPGGTDQPGVGAALAPASPAPAAPSTAPPPTTQPTPAAKRRPLRATVRGSQRARRSVTLTVTRRHGAKRRTTYRVKLVRAGRTVATGTLRGRTLRLRVRDTAKGKRVRYPRLRGSYRLAAAGGTRRPAIVTTRIVVR